MCYKPIWGPGAVVKVANLTSQKLRDRAPLRHLDIKETHVSPLLTHTRTLPP